MVEEKEDFEPLKSTKSDDLRSADPFYDIDLRDLADPHSLCQYLRQFPMYKVIKSPPNTIDTAVCLKLSAMTYQMQLNGSFFLDSFSRKDFDHLMAMSLLSGSTSTTPSISLSEYDSDWIWTILSKAISCSNVERVSPADSAHLQWIGSSWHRHGILKNEQLPTSSKPDGLILVNYDDEKELSPSSISPEHGYTASDPVAYRVDFNRFPRSNQSAQSIASLSPLQSSTSIPDELEYHCILSPAMNRMSTAKIMSVLPMDSNMEYSLIE